MGSITPIASPSVRGGFAPALRLGTNDSSLLPSLNPSDSRGIFDTLHHTRVGRV